MERYREFIHSFIDICIICVFVILLDQWTKWLITVNLRVNEYIPIINGFFNIVHVTNTGAAFSIFANSGDFGRIFLKFIPFVVLFLLFFNLYISPKKDVYIVIATGLISGGALGNLTDRLKMGKVIDFLDFYIGPYHWPAFNVADIAITSGAFFFFLHFFINRELY